MATFEISFYYKAHTKAIGHLQWSVVLETQKMMFHHYKVPKYIQKYAYLTPPIVNHLLQLSEESTYFL